MKKKLLVSFSGGETSAFMAQWLWRHKQDDYEMIFVFANTGEENEQTYEFIEKCSAHFGFPVVWIESVTSAVRGVGQSFNIVDFATASRKGEPFEGVISKHGIPNQNTPHCTRDLKEKPITKYAKSIGWADHYTAIGIRYDEADRYNKNAKQQRLIYPLISMVPMTKQKINFWWSQQTFRLNLKGYEGNCKWCWKKSLQKLYQLAKDNPQTFDFPKEMENKYGAYVPEARRKRMEGRGVVPVIPVRFFRGNRSVDDILEESRSWNKSAMDDSQDLNYQLDLIGGDSCEIFSECGSE